MCVCVHCKLSTSAVKEVVCSSPQVPNFDTYVNNPVCLPLPWETDQAMYSKWLEGRTGYPWIDAAMRQLSRDGWIHACLRLGV